MKSEESSTLGDLREASRKFYALGPNEMTFEHINVGSLQRVAQSVEVIAQNFAQTFRQLISERDRYLQSSKDDRELAEKRLRIITRLQKRIKKLGGE